MNYEFSPETYTPAALRTEQPAPRRTGRFAETRDARLMRGIFGWLCRYTPAVAARLAFGLLARPPRPDVRDWHLLLRRKALHRRMKCGASELSVYEWGSGPTVLLVHGWGSHATHMGRMVLPLVDAGYRVVAFDAPAHGLSTGSTTDLLEFARSIAAVAADVGPLDAVVAHSFGAAMALYAARDWGVDTQKMVLISPFVHFNWFLDAFAEHTGLTPQVMDRVRNIQVERYGGRLDWSRMSVADMARIAPIPLLVIHDEDDQEVPVEHGLAVAAAGQDACFHGTRGLGHQLVVRNAAVITQVVDFVSARAHAHAAR